MSMKSNRSVSTRPPVQAVQPSNSTNPEKIFNMYKTHISNEQNKAKYSQEFLASTTEFLELLIENYQTATAKEKSDIESMFKIVVNPILTNKVSTTEQEQKIQFQERLIPVYQRRLFAITESSIAAAEREGGIETLACIKDIITAKFLLKSSDQKSDPE